MHLFFYKTIISSNIKLSSSTGFSHILSTTPSSICPSSSSSQYGNKKWLYIWRKSPICICCLDPDRFALSLLPCAKKRVKFRNIGLPPPITYPCGYFDGAAAGNIGGAGFVLYLNNSHCLYFTLGCGSSTNTRSELLALWALLSVSKIMGIPLHSIYGDSLVIISWAIGNGSLKLPHLSHWCDDIRELLHIFPEVIMKHIYREHNQIANSLSKKALSLDSRFGIFKESLNDMIIDHGNFQLY